MGAQSPCLDAAVVASGHVYLEKMVLKVSDGHHMRPSDVSVRMCVLMECDAPSRIW